MRSIWLLVLACVVTALPAAAEELTLTLDPEATKVTFTLGAVMHTVRGSVPVEKGKIRFDLDSGAASGEIVLSAKGVRTGNSSRDKTMHAQVLESARHPEICFKPQRLKGSLKTGGTSIFQLVGEVALHGSTQPLTLAVRSSERDGRVEATATVEVPYVAWGLEDPSTFVLRVAKKLDVKIQAKGKLSD